MKKFNKTVLAILFALLCVLSFSACGLFGEEDEGLPKLTVPKNLQIENETLTWDTVENATGYLVQVDNNTAVENGLFTEYSLTELTEDKIYQIKVKAKGDGINYSDSNWSAAESYTVGNGGVQTKLATPINLQINGTLLTWDALNNTTDYTVDIDGIMYDTVSASYGLAVLFEPETYHIKVKANGNGTSYLTSDWSEEIEYTVTLTEGLKYTLINDDTEYSVSKGQATDAVIVISDTYNGKPVTEIAEKGFYEYSGLTGIVIPDNITSIRYKAFSGCTGLTSITIPPNIKSIYSYAFEYCRNLSNIYFNAVNCDIKMNYSAYNVFVNAGMDQEGIEMVIGAEVTKIPSHLFWVNATNSNTVMPKITRVLSEKNSKCENISAYAFRSCVYLTSITIPDSVTIIGNNSFQYCTSLASITIPDSVNKVGYEAFLGCTNLTSVKLGNGINSVDRAFGNTGIWNNAPDNDIVYIDKWAVGRKGTLNYNISLKAGTVGIGDYALSGLKNLISITLPNGIKKIGTWALSECPSLVSITIPDSVTYIGGGPFSACTSLIGITVSESNNLYCSIDGVLYDKPLTTVKQYPAGKNGNTFVIPNGVSVIGMGAFSYCALTSIVIPNTVTSIKSFAFYGISNLTVYYCGVDSAAWNDISIESYNSFLDATRYYYSETNKAGNYWRYVNDVPTVWE